MAEYVDLYFMTVRISYVMQYASCSNALSIINFEDNMQFVITLVTCLNLLSSIQEKNHPRIMKSQHEITHTCITN